VRIKWPATTLREPERVSPYQVSQAESFDGGAVTLGPGEIVTLTNVGLNTLPADFLKENM
jgi:hypothetical protein